MRACGHNAAAVAYAPVHMAGGVLLLLLLALLLAGQAGRGGDRAGEQFERLNGDLEGPDTVMRSA